MTKQVATVVLSGGQDSTTCLGYALAKYGPGNVRAVTFDYGQRHEIEIRAARAVIAHFEDAYTDLSAGVSLSIPHEIVQLGPVFAGRSPLTNSAEQLETYTDAASMDAIIGDRVETTFVPMRNAVFLMLAANRAVCADSFVLVTGVCQADNANYPDCREDFVDSAQTTINEALGLDADAAFLIRDGDCINNGDLPRSFVIETPLMHMSKAESIALALRAPYTYAALAHSHTAYDGKYPPTGSDHASILRADGFEKAGVPDPLVMRAFLERLMPLPDTSNYSVQNIIARGRKGMIPWDAETFARRYFDELDTLDTAPVVSDAEWDEANRKADHDATDRAAEAQREF